jgi:hypothetical protein
VRPTEDAPEKETLAGLLDFLRATVVNKVAGLSDEQARTASVPPSTLTPAGVVKHLAGVERFWFSVDFAGLDVAWPWTEDDPHGAFGSTTANGSPTWSSPTRPNASDPGRSSRLPASRIERAARG